MNDLLVFPSSHPERSLSPFSYLVAFLFLLAPGLAQGERGTGTLAGRVMNAATNVYLEGALVSVQGTDHSALTQPDGSYRLEGVPSGNHTLSVSYTGLDSTTLPVAVTPGVVTVQDLGMRSSIYTMSEFTVTGEREGSAMAITVQKNAPGMKTVLSSDHFGSLHTQNLGSFLQRLPGISTAEVEGEITDIFIRGMGGDLNSVTLDGVALPSSSVKLASDRGADINKISADFIGAVELIRAPTADQESQALGGQINLVMKTPFDQKGRVFTYTAGGTYDVDEPRGIRPFATVGFSDVFGENERFGLIVSSSWSEYTNSSSLAQQSWVAPTATNPNWAGVLTLWRKDFAEKTRGNVNLSAYYKLTDTTQVYAKTFYQLFRDGYESYNHTLPLGAPNIAGSTPDVTARNNGQFSSQRWHRKTYTDTGYLTLGGKTRLDGLLLDYEASYFKTDGHEDQSETNRMVAGTSYVTDRTGSPGLPENRQTAGPSWSSWDASRLNLLNRLTENDDEQFTAKLDVRRRFDPGLPVSIKTGVKFNDRKKIFNVDWPRWNYIGVDGVAGSADDNLEAQFADDSWDDVIFGRYDVIPFQNSERVFFNRIEHPTWWAEDRLNGFIQSNRRDYTAREETFTAYLMGDTKIKRLAINAGVRAEKTKAENTSLQEFLNEPVLEERFGTFVTKTGDYTSVLPSLHLKYFLQTDLLLRGSYTETFGRPKFDQLRPRVDVNDELMRVVANNPDLTPWTSQNTEISLEYYFEPIGQLSVSVFNKEMNDLVMSLSTEIGAGAGNGFGGQYAGYELITKQNGGAARARGIELSYMQQFTFLPGWLRGLGAFANYTYQKTEGTYIDTDRNAITTQLPNYVPRTANAGLTYNAYGVSFRATMNWLDDYLVIRSVNPELHQFRFARTTIDLKASYAISPRYRIEASLINLTNEPINDYNGVKERYRRYLERGRALTFGIHGRF